MAMGSKSKRHWPATCLTGVILAGLLAAASAQARSVTVENNCAEGPRCLRVYNDITRIEFCLDPGQSYTLDGLDSDATYCAWCNADRLPDDCKQWPVRFD